MATEISPGFAIRKHNSEKPPIPVQPSILAASSNSFGTVSKGAEHDHAMGMVNAKSAMMSEKWVSKPCLCNQEIQRDDDNHAGIICPNKELSSKPHAL